VTKRTLFENGHTLVICKIQGFIVMLSIIGFLSGFAIGVFLYGSIVLPLVYGLPVSIYYYVKRKVRVGAVFYHFVLPLIWLFAITMLGLVLHLIAPATVDFVTNDPSSILGQFAAIAALLLNFLRSKGRTDMRLDYMRSTYARFARNR
jgi:hypothetical protein